MSQITDNDLKSRSEYVEIAVNSVEHCARYLHTFIYIIEI